MYRSLWNTIRVNIRKRQAESILTVYNLGETNAYTNYGICVYIILFNYKGNNIVIESIKSS